MYWPPAVKLTALRFPTEWICAYCVTVTIQSIIYVYSAYRLVLLWKRTVFSVKWNYVYIYIYIYIYIKCFVKCRSISDVTLLVYSTLHNLCVGIDLDCKFCFRDRLLWRAILKSGIFDEICFLVIMLHPRRIVCQCILCSQFGLKISTGFMCLKRFSGGKMWRYLGSA